MSAMITRAEAGGKSENLHSALAGVGYDQLCRFKDVAYRPFGQQHVGIDWPWPEQTRFAPDALANLTYRPDRTDRVNLRGRLSRVRVEHPEPEPGADLNHTSWYPCPRAPGEPYRYRVSRFIQPGELDDSVRGCDLFVLPLQLPGNQRHFVPGPVGPVDPLELRRPGAWAVIEDPLTGEQATVTFQTGALRPSAFRGISTNTGHRPNLTGAVFAGAIMDTMQLGLSHPAESVVLAYAPRLPPTRDGQPATPPRLYLGLAEREGNRWLSREELFGEGVTLPDVSQPQIFFSSRQNAVLLLGQTVDATGIPQPNTLVTVSLPDGAIRARRLHFLEGLSGYTAVLDSGQDRLVVVGGRRTWCGPVLCSTSQVSEVWVHDLGTGAHYRLPLSTTAPPGAARSAPGVVLDPIRRRALVAGGYANGFGARSDVWQVNLISGEWTFLGDGASATMPGMVRPFVQYDPRRDRLWIAEARAQLGDGAIRAWELDLELGVFEEQVLLGISTTGYQVRDGAPAVIAYQVETSAIIGDVFRAQVISPETHLELAVQDEWGNTLNTGNPEVVWSGLPGEIYRLVVSTGPGYPTGTSTGFQLEVSSVTLAEVGRYQTNWTVRGLSISGQTAYLATKEGLEVVSLADPSNPVRLSRLRLGRKGRGLAAVGRWLAYVRGPGNNSLRIFDLLDPTQPVLAGEAFFAPIARDVTLWSRTAYVAQGRFGVAVVDLIDPASPQLVDTLTSSGQAMVVQAADRVLYVGQRDRVIQLYQLDGTETAPLGRVSTTLVPVSIRVHGSKLIVAELSKKRAKKCFGRVSRWRPVLVEIFDVSDPQAPLLEATLPYDGLEGLFAAPRGGQLLIPSRSGFSVQGVVDP